MKEILLENVYVIFNKKKQKIALGFRAMELIF